MNPAARCFPLVAYLLSAFAIHAQIVLTGTNYSQNFDSISTGLPVGWSVRTNAGATALGEAVSFSPNAATWADSAFGFKNLASTWSNSGTNFIGSENSTTQHGTTNRTLGVRQTSGVAGGDPGAALVMQLQNTVGLGNFQLTLDFNMLSVQGRSTTWSVDYGVGSNPSTFAAVGTYEDPGIYGTTTRSFGFGTGIENRNEPVWIRVVALTATSGSGSRDTCGIDNVSLSYGPFAGTPPTISSHPQSLSITDGGEAMFAVLAEGSSPLSYQWFFNSTAINNATNSVLSFSGVTFGMAGNYSVLVSNAYGALTSSVAQLTVQPAPPVITVQPQNTSAPLGSNVMFSVAVSGTPPFNYQWARDGGVIPAATNSFLTITNVSQSDLGDYVVSISNAAGSTNSLPAKLTISINTVALLTYNVKGNGVSDFSTNTAQVQALGRQLVYLQPDIVTFNEIPAGRTFEVTNIVRQYLPGYYWATNSGTDGYIRSAIVSRWPISRSQRWLFNSSLTNFGYEGNFTRDLFEAEINVPGFGDPLHVFTAHLKSGSDRDSSTRRAAEARSVSNYFVNGFLTTNAHRPYVLTGDLNEDIDRPPSNSQQPIQTLTSGTTDLRLTTPRNPFSNDERT
ncbi:MAG: immunoglobulin domain-containing protein, partial [Limisphaerales bacterium]